MIQAIAMSLSRESVIRILHFRSRAALTKAFSRPSDSRGGEKKKSTSESLEQTEPNIKATSLLEINDVCY